MPKKQIPIRDIPTALYEWIENQRHAQRCSQKEFLLKVLESAATYGTGTSQPTLFDFQPAIAKPIDGPFPFTFIDLFAGIGGMRLVHCTS